MKKPSVNVFVSHEPVGQLARSDVEEGTILFGYRDRAASENAVSLTMPIRADQYDAMGGLLPIFEMNLPEGALKLMVVYACTIGNGDAHLKNFSVVYRHAEDAIELAPAYDLVSTQTYLPEDSLALTLDGSKAFPDRARLIKFVRQVTGKTQRAATRLLEQAKAGAEAAVSNAARYAKRHKDAKAFVERFNDVMRAGLERLEA